MAWQEIAALGIVGLTGLAFLGRVLRSRRLPLPSRPSCDCGVVAAGRPPPSVIFRARKGQRGQIVVRQKQAGQK